MQAALSCVKRIFFDEEVNGHNFKYPLNKSEIGAFDVRFLPHQWQHCQ